ncbi:MAG: hypothetical protein HDT09_01395 [Bacteroidales bacterium]|nr:hypothetical protein [Bacteroidales bacterium]
MKKYLLVALLPLLAMACKNEGKDIPVRDAAVVFNIETIASPENIGIDYSSPDPCCGVPKYYSIVADGNPNELVMKATNIEKITLVQAVETTCSLVNEEVLTTRGKVINSAVSFENSACTFEIVDDNVLKITLNELSDQMSGKVDYTQIRFIVADASNPVKAKDEIVFSRVYTIPLHN